ncbi:hypothetical protein LW347_21455 [Pectobacterium polonicum]|uniref:Uncharacterized protein n=1 Tax=Pectobacterium polonicum TaxID=2485124 RepID=A0AAE9NSJ9_9GAMM|nr:hypothetical protein [Pectobacterium polonicum]UVO08357.1 hypothetical protein LW347_21455 [Pectobacterium polonicum]
MTDNQQNTKKFVFVAVETLQPIFGWAFFTTGIGRCDVTSIIHTKCTMLVRESALWQQARCPMLGRS